ncbi:glycosyltransferase [Tumidithrix elongata RA019]|uniref:Glycosyltransferase n=1 Tax=Tumidithrix elongata BACA0141 TaxID=2716417 RepID=A0AAW9PUA7_9CYAN|nr:glycosyltransferase [Tumidithrix elongata RA019]
MSLPFFEEFGWEPVVLAVRPECIEGVYDRDLEQTIPSHLSITRIGILPAQISKYFGVRSLSLRCLPSFLWAGDRLLKTQHFDLIYFSTTVFTTMILAARWRDRFNIPYVLDFQDPWINDYYELANLPPPGGKLKYGFSQMLARRFEPSAVSQASHILSVSPEYPKTFMQRYPTLDPDKFTVLPFAASERDFDLLPMLNIQQSIFDRQDGKKHWVYVGRAGNDIMGFSLRALFLAIQTLRQARPKVWENVELHFVGTSYISENQVKTVEAIAQEFKVADLVKEYPQRLPYFEALQILSESDAILLIGSDAAGYTASKIYPCILARKPILAIFNQQSSVVEVLQRCQAGELVTFNSNLTPMDLLTEISTKLNWLLSLPPDYLPTTNWEAFQPYTAREMTQKQCAIFDRCVSPLP